MCNDEQGTIYRKPTPAWTLKVIQGFDIGEEFTLSDSQEYTIGRQNCDITINTQDKKASRRHARLVFKTDQLFLENLSQTTTTRVNDRPITKIKLKAGNKIGIGATVFVLERTGISQYKNKGKSKTNFKWIGVAACVLILSVVIFKVLWSSQPPPVRPPDEIPTPTKQPGIILIPTATKQPDAIPTATNKPSATLTPTKKPDTIPNSMIDKEEADEFFRQGKIFYNDGNLKKAIRLFESASDYPDHPHASKYLKKAKEKLDIEINQLVTDADKSARMLKYDRAKQLLREVIELLSDNPQDKRYTDALNKLRKLENG